MCDRLREIFARNRVEQCDVPSPRGGKCVERGPGVEGSGPVVAGPSVLIERLDYVMRLGECLREKGGESDFTVGEMEEDLADPPLSRWRGAFACGWSRAFSERVQLRGRFLYHVPSVVFSKDFVVGVSLPRFLGADAMGKAT